LHHAVRVKRLWLWLPLLLVSAYMAMALVIIGAGVVTVLASSRPAPNTHHAFVKRLNQTSSLAASVSADHKSIELTGPAAQGAITFPIPTAATSPDFYSTPLGDVLVVWREKLGMWSRTIDALQTTSSGSYRETFTSPSGQVFDDLIVVMVFQPMVWSSVSVD